MATLNIGRIFSSQNIAKEKSKVDSEKSKFVLVDEELRTLFNGVILTFDEVTALNSMSNTFKDFKAVKTAIRALKESIDSTDTSRNAGRKKKTLPVPKEIIKLRHDTGESYEDIAKSYDMSRTTLYNLLNEK